MDDDSDDRDDTKRRTRNLSEKKRRDQFNMLVNELSSMVSTTNRKMDKSTVLKSTIAFLKNHNDITVRSRAHEVQDDWKPTFLPNEEFTFLVLEALEGFLIVFSESGRIHYVSESITSLLGHKPRDVMSQNIFDLVHEDDRAHMYGILSIPTVPVGHFKDNELRFQLLIRRGTLDFRNEPAYELIQFSGHLRPRVEQPNSEDRTNHKQNHKTGLLFVCTGRLQTPHLVRDVSILDVSRNEFTSRHSLEWKFLFLDHRASPIIGYLPFEVLGTSGYDYYHFDDLEKVVTCHEALMQKGELTSCCYRFLTKGQQWIWLQTRFYITYHQWNSKPEFVVCTHRVVSPEMSDNLKEEDVDNDTLEVEVIPPNPLSEKLSGTVSPSGMSEASDAFASCTSYAHISQSPAKSVSAGSPAGTVGTVGTVATAGTLSVTNGQWNYLRCQNRASTDCGSVSGDDRSSHRNSDREPTTPKVQPEEAMPQCVIGTQYLEPAPYIHAVSVGAVLPVPVLVTSDQAEAQLRRKHEELQQMIERQQAELRQVRKQLLLARLGILPPMITPTHAADVNIDEPQNIPQLMYEPSTPSLPGPEYGPPPPQ